MRTSNKTKNGFTSIVVEDEKVFELPKIHGEWKLGSTEIKMVTPVDVWVLNTVGLLPISELISSSVRHGKEDILVLKIYFSFLKFIYFNWRLITLQYCIGFAIHWHESITGYVFPILNPLPHPSPSHPSGSSQCTSSKHPVSCIEPGLAIHFIYDNIHVSMPFSQIIPPSPSPSESKRLFYTSVSLLLSRIQGYHYHLSKFHIYALVYSIGVFLSDLLYSV